jgi:hypothetical protein
VDVFAPTRPHPPYTPLANAFAERWVGTVRRELCDRTLILEPRHLEQLLREYVEHCNTHRPHRSVLDAKTPEVQTDLEGRSEHLFGSGRELVDGRYTVKLARTVSLACGLASAIDGRRM